MGCGGSIAQRSDWEAARGLARLIQPWLPAGLSGRWKEAIRVLLEARRNCTHEGAFPGTTHLALAYDATGDRRAALHVLESDLASCPSVDLHRTYAQMVLAEGRLREGWPHYEFRWLAEPLVGNRMPLAIPEWQGQPLDGKRILLRVEQGFGDAFQFLRYAPLLQRRGATVKLTRFCDLAPRFLGVDEVLDGPVDQTSIDYFVNLVSLPKAFDTDLGSIPADIPYVSPDEDKVAQWRTRIDDAGSKLKVGLVWSGNPAFPGNRERSMPMSVVRELLATEDVAWFLLQKGARAVEAKEIASSFTVVDLGPDLLDYGDTAAAIANLDLVISVCTSVVHLAGAMGRPVWLLLGTPSDWRWLDGREDTPWYPTMRLFRQSTPAGWSEVVRRVATEIRQYRAAGASSFVQVGRAPALDATATESAGTMDEPMEVASTPADAINREKVVHTSIGMLQIIEDGSAEGWSLMRYGEFLRGELDVLCAAVPVGGTGVVYGPGVGSHAIPLSQALGATGLLILVEPRPAEHRLLRQNLTLHSCGNATLLARASTLASESVHQARRQLVDDLQLERLDLLVVGDHDDIPGILEGASQSIWRTRPVLILRLREGEVWFSLVRRLDDFGYRAWKMDTALFRPENFNRQTDDGFSGRRVCTILAYPEEATPARLPACCEEIWAGSASQAD